MTYAICPFTYHVEFYNDEFKYQKEVGITFAASLAEAMSKVSTYYGEGNIVKCTVVAFSDPQEIIPLSPFEVQRLEDEADV